MPKVENLTDRGISLARWRILPNGCDAVSPTGQRTKDVPADVAYSPRAKEMAVQGLLAIEGFYVKPKQAKIVVKAVKEEVPAVAVKEDAETEGLAPKTIRKMRKKDRK